MQINFCKMYKWFLYLFFLSTVLFIAILNLSSCQPPFLSSPRRPNQPEPMIPQVIRGAWFSREKNVNTLTEFDDRKMTNRGYLVDMIEEHHVNFTFIFQQDNCYHCVRLFVRTVNILEKIESMLRERYECVLCCKVLCLVRKRDWSIH